LILKAYHAGLDFAQVPLSGLLLESAGGTGMRLVISGEPKTKPRRLLSFERSFGTRVI